MIPHLWSTQIWPDSKGITQFYLPITRPRLDDKNSVCVVHIASPLTSNRHRLSYDDCLENKGRLQDCSCSIGSYHCIQCYAHILWAAPTGQTDLSLSHWVHFTVLRCICVFVFSCISLHACCIIVTRWGGPGGIEAWSDDWPSSFSALTLLVGSHDL